MRKIYITDLIGSYSGMDYYDTSFCNILQKAGHNVEFLSTFNVDNKKPFFPVIFKHNKFKSTLFLLFCFAKFLIHQIKNPNAIYIYMSYGEFYDVLMMLTNVWSKKMICDIHEVHALKYKDDSSVSRFFNWYYKKTLRRYIYHSERTLNILNEVGVTAKGFYVEHFDYNFPKTYNENLLTNEVKTLFTSENIKFLFFGNLSRVKGIDTTIDVFSNLSDEEKQKVELVVAGKNVDNINFEKLRSSSENFKVFDRHITDDELVYLYSHTDYILLPYEKSSQSGIFAMAKYFRKAMLLSDIPYFKKMIEDYPSYGILSKKEDFLSLVKQIINCEISKEFFTKEDIEKNEAENNASDFIKALDSEIEE